MSRLPHRGFFRKVQDGGDRPMQRVRFVRPLVPFLILGLVGCVFGCSGEETKTPEERKAFGKMMLEDMKNAQKEMRAAKGITKGGAQGKPSR
jgi:hypothetical protein